MKATLNRTSVPLSFMALEPSCLQVQPIDMSKIKKKVPTQGKLLIVQICRPLQLQAFT